MIEVSYNCESDTEPNKYIIENIINGKCDIVLCDDIKEIIKIDKDEQEKKYYIYDIYRIVKNNYRDTLEDDLKNETNFNMWLNFVKEQYENQAEEVSIEERLSTAEAVIAEILGGEV